MAKLTKSVSFAKAKINLEDMTITEINKDDSKVFDLMEILNEWDGINNISITIKKDDDVKPLAKEDENEDEDQTEFELGEDE